ncbi:MAG: undecaprenyldiphospho-muramoylpentapeptide beta-N-acetylglucosaminyltransferase [Saprospiraceae bacterium]|nr:undecaprenyldiphospho-muramoylpentapeptide beta-N-acetylglucosaminyltransferase [Saprospiraceae bacterium]
MKEGLRRVIISGGGSGGHVFPAITIANELRSRFPGVDILFVGAKGKIEMEKVPLAGYKIEGLWISGLQRSLTWRNVMFPIKLASSLLKARNILRNFRPQVVVGVGGFASGPTLYVAAKMGIPTLVQEQNSYPGLTNRWLAKSVNRICVAYDKMERFFPKGKLALTGNPVRLDLESPVSREKAQEHFGLEPRKKTILVMGGSLGARTFNQVMASQVEKIVSHQEIQWIWQIGKIYKDTFLNCSTANLKNVAAKIFIDQMDLAYRASDLIICRAGALTISEICLLGKPAILVPSPNVAEDHQTVNARSLSDQSASRLISDHEAPEKLIETALQLIHNENELNALAKQARKLAEPNATKKIISEILTIVR